MTKRAFWLAYRVFVSFALLLVISCTKSQVQPRSNHNNSYPNQQYQQQTYSPPPAKPEQGYYAQPAPYYDGGYQYKQQPASRYYKNPYTIQQQSQYPYYDGDQYYVPPTSYGSSTDNLVPSFSDQKF
jgi:hypothetical protein